MKAKTSQQVREMKSQSSGATKWLFLAVVLLSLPLCLQPFIAWTAASIPWLTVELTLANESDESIFITPVRQFGQPPTVTIPQRYSAGQIRALRQTDIRLAPGDSIRLYYNAEFALPTGLAIRDEAGSYRYLALDRGAWGTLANEPEIIYTVDTLSTLPSLDGDVLTAVNSANRFSFDARFWAGMLLATAAGGVPFALFLLWFRRYRRPRSPA